YYNGGEAEWTFGLPWLAICHKLLGNKEKHSFYLKKTKEALNDRGELPELYFANSEKHNENIPLAWSMSLKLVAESL
ncbi:glycoside hydrolase family 15, partial [Candidatus Woesearchaeota archaeon]